MRSDMQKFSGHYYKAVGYRAGRGACKVVLVCSGVVAVMSLIGGTSAVFVLAATAAAVSVYGMLHCSARAAYYSQRVERHTAHKVKARVR